MLPPLEELLSAYAFLKRRHRWRWHPDAAGIGEALREAEAIANGRVEDEPAALFFALTRRRNDLGDAWETLPVLVVQQLTRTSLQAELRVTVEDSDLRALRMRIVERELAKRATFDDVRAFLAARLRPLP
ncbi:MAG: hypothetical protein QM820_51805 [Minicystis sp.]